MQLSIIIDALVLPGGEYYCILTAHWLLFKLGSIGTNHISHIKKPDQASKESRQQQKTGPIIKYAADFIP